MVDHPFDMSFERTESSDDSYAIVGRALAYAQRFEGDCWALDMLLRAKSGELSRDMSFDDEDSFRELVNRVHQASLYDHIRQIVEHLELPQDTVRTLDIARQCRNEIAHEICLGIQFEVETDEGRERLAHSVSAAVRPIAEAHLLILVIMCIKTDEALPRKRYLDRYSDRVVEWVCWTEET